MSIRVLPGGKHMLVSDGGYWDEYLSVVDLSTGTVVQREPFLYADRRALFFGMAVRSDGMIYISGGGTDAVYVYSYDPASTTPLTKVDEIALNPGAYASGLAFVDDTHLLVGYQSAGAVALYDTSAVGGSEVGSVSLGGDYEPYDIAVDSGRQEAYVSLWGNSAVAVLDVSGTTPTVSTMIPVGKDPEALLLVPPSTLLVANADSDSVSVIDQTTDTVTQSIDVAPTATSKRGTTPNHLAISPDGSLLYVADAGEDCLDVLATSDWHRIGRVPTAHYPTAVATLADGTVYVAEAKGMGYGPSTYEGLMNGGINLHGTIHTFPQPQDGDLVAGAATVDANNQRMASNGGSVTCPATGDCRWPLPPTPGLPTPIQHVVLILRENKTYDANLGDLGTDANGDPTLVEWGENITPNLHALARAFTNGDNFYSNAEASLQGHQWCTAGVANDFTEKGWLTGWGRGFRDPTEFASRKSAPEDGSYFQVMTRAGIDYVDEGEAVGLAEGKPGDKPIAIDRAWPGGIYFNLDSKDVDKAVYFANNVTHGYLPRFSFVMLPNNHTQGMTPGKWTPEYMVADNDEATGRIVDAISHSPFWYTTAIFIVEDDPSDGADHVEAHRSTLVIVSPWAKHSYTTKVHYDVPAMWRTIELLLGLPPESQQTADAAPMFDAFTTTPDYTTTYTYIPSNIPEAMNPSKPTRLSMRSAQMDFSTVDNAPELGQVLWEHRMHTPAPFLGHTPFGIDRPERFNVLGGEWRQAGSAPAPKAKDDDDDDDDD
jgi:YVTN family beta-propeller protein